jgi:phosphohistidine phosphatase
MELYIFRHGLSPTLQEAGVKFDAERPLSAEGREKTRKCAEGMRALGIEVDLILSSPFLRAKETAVIAHDELKVESAVDYSPALAIALDVEPAVEELIARFKTHKSIMIVGHEPHLTSLIGRVCGDSKLRVELKKAGLVKIEIIDASRELRGYLHWLVSPKILMAAAAS